MSIHPEEPTTKGAEKRSARFAGVTLALTLAACGARTAIDPGSDGEGTGGLGSFFPGRTLEGSCSFECPECAACREHYDDANAPLGCGHLVPDPEAYIWSKEPCPTEGLLGVCVLPERLVASYYYRDRGLDAASLEESCIQQDGTWR